MRFTSFALALSSAVAVVASTQPCAEHTTAAHDAIALLQPLLTPAEAADLLPALQRIIKKRKTPKTTSINTVVKLSPAPAKVEPPTSTPAVVAAPVPVASPVSSPKAVPNTWSGKTKVVKKDTPKVKEPTKKTVVAGTKNAVDGFAHSGYVPESVAIKLQEGESSSSRLH